MPETTLAISGVELPIGSSRFIQADWEPINGGGSFRRTVNGELVHTGRDVFRKWALTLNCTDQSAPTLANAWPGTIATVGFPGRLRVVGGTSVSLPRDPVAGSVRGVAVDGAHVEPTAVDGRDVSFTTAPAVVEFRPELTMMITEHSENLDERRHEIGWTIRLEEV